jgi:hypothetical protein
MDPVKTRLSRRTHWEYAFTIAVIALAMTVILHFAGPISMLQP